MLVEAPIDALSYVALKRPEETIILSVSGSHATRPVLDAAHERGWELAIGFDNDGPSKAGWEHCRENYRLLYPDDTQPSRTLPTGKDWNDDLRIAPAAATGGAYDPASPTRPFGQRRDPPKAPMAALSHNTGWHIWRPFRALAKWTANVRA